jgi:acyl-CoA thioester hydrolase
MISATVALETRFYDLDPMSVVWHGNYARFLEEARSALLGKIGYDYFEMKASGFAWPVVEMKIKYVRALRFPQRFTVTATLEEYENRIRIGYLLRGEDGKVTTRADTTQVAVSIATGELNLVSPPELIEKVKACLSADASA